METDKILIFTAVFLLLIAFTFREEIVQEGALWSQSEAVALSEELAGMYFYPLSQREKLEALQEYIGKMEALQDRVACSIFAKHFVDYSDAIAENREDLVERQARPQATQDLLSFITAEFFDVIAEPGLAREQLVQLGVCIDAAFHEQAERAMFSVVPEEDCVVVHISPYGTFYSTYVQAFTNQISKDVFEGKPVVLCVDSSDADEEIFQSENVTIRRA